MRGMMFSVWGFSSRYLQSAIFVRICNEHLQRGHYVFIVKVRYKVQTKHTVFPTETSYMLIPNTDIVCRILVVVEVPSTTFRERVPASQSIWKLHLQNRNKTPDAVAVADTPH